MYGRQVVHNVLVVKYPQDLKLCTIFYLSDLLFTLSLFDQILQWHIHFIISDFVESLYDIFYHTFNSFSVIFCFLLAF